MAHRFFPLLSLLLLVGNLLAEENTPTGLLRFSVTDGITPIPAQVTLLDNKGKPVQWDLGKGTVVVSGPVQTTLPSGHYTLLASAGPRRIISKSSFHLKSKGKNLKLDLLPFFPVGEGEWIFFDPFLAISENEKDKLSLILSAADLHAAGISSTFPLPPLDSVSLVRADSWASGRAYTLSPNVTMPVPTAVSKPKPAEDGSFSPLPLMETLIHHRDQGGLTVWASPTQLPDASYSGRPLTESELHQQALLATSFILATVAGPLYDAIDLSNSPENLKLWGGLLSSGYRLTAFCGGPSPKSTTSPHLAAIGAYLKPPEENTSEALLTRLKEASHTISNGPLLTLTVNGFSPGTTLQAGTTPLNIAVSAFSSPSHTDAIAKVELIYNGRVIHRNKGNEDQRSLHLKLQYPCTKGGWLFARYVSTEAGRFAVTNPVYLKSTDVKTAIGLISTVYIRGERDGRPTPFIAEAWNLGTLLKRFSIPVAGRSLTLPCTATIIPINSDSNPGQPITLYHSSDAATFASRLAQRRETLGTVLANPETYQKMRFLLESMNILVPLN